MPASQYCKQLLSDSSRLAAWDRATEWERTKISMNEYDAKEFYSSSQIDDCRRVQAALDGRDAEIKSFELNNIGKGGKSAFHSLRLVMLSFTLEAGTSFEDVVSDISKELAAAPTKSVVTSQNAFGGTLQEQKATWKLKNLQVETQEMRSFQYGDLGVFVGVADSEFLKAQEAARQTTRPSTIH